MILVDTSVWIEFLKRNEYYFSDLRTQIENQTVFAFEPIFGELLQGVKNRREKEIIEQYWKFLPKIDIDECWIKAGMLSAERKLLSHGVGLVDTCILVASTETNSRIWTLDKKLLNIVPEELVYLSDAK